MQRVVVLKLPTAPHQECLETTKAYQEACNQVSKSTQAGARANAVSLHHTHYTTLRETLPSQMAQNVLRTVAGAYKSWEKNGATPPLSADRSRNTPTHGTGACNPAKKSPSNSSTNASGSPTRPGRSGTNTCGSPD